MNRTQVHEDIYRLRNETKDQHQHCSVIEQPVDHRCKTDKIQNHQSD